MRNRIPIIQRPEHFQLNRNHSLHNGLVFAGLGQYPSSTRYHDSSSLSNTGTLTGMDPATDWVWNSYLNRFVLDFDGSNDYVNVGFWSWLSGATALTVCAFGYPLDTTERALLARWDGSVLQFLLEQQGGAILVATGTVGGYDIATGPAIVTSTWSHFSMTFNGGTKKVTAYLNGVGGTPGNTGGSAISSSTELTRVGAAATGKWWKGSLADTLVYNRVLSPSEIQSLADPSNVLLSGLILPPRRRLYAVPAVATGNRRRRLLICGAA